MYNNLTDKEENYANRDGVSLKNADNTMSQTYHQRMNLKEHENKKDICIWNHEGTD